TVSTPLSTVTLVTPLMMRRDSRSSIIAYDVLVFGVMTGSGSLHWFALMSRLTHPRASTGPVTLRLIVQGTSLSSQNWHLPPSYTVATASASTNFPLSR